MSRAARAVGLLVGALLFLCLAPASAFAAEFSVSSEAELRDALERASGAMTIWVEESFDLTFTVTVSQDVTLTSTGPVPIATINVGPSCSGPGFQVNSGGTLTLEGVTIDGTGHTRSALVSVNAGGTLVMKDGSAVINNGYTGVSVGGTFIMDGGTISGNVMTGDGGGVSVGGTFIMDGGTISGNTAKLTATTAAGNGGGVYVQSNGRFTMNSGTISGNTTERWGGGICGDPGASSTITINDGTISGNSSTYDSANSTSAVNGGGGGIYLGCGTLSITGGHITENTALSNGGGIAFGWSSQADSRYYDVSITGGDVSGNEATLGRNLIAYAPVTLGSSPAVTDGIYLHRNSDEAD